MMQIIAQGITLAMFASLIITTALFTKWGKH